MRVRLLIDSKKVDKLIPFSGGYIEIYKKGEVCFACSETYEFYCQLLLNMIDSDGLDFSVRINTEILAKLLDGSFLDISVTTNSSGNEEVVITSMTKRLEFLYSYTIPKQTGAIDPSKFIALSSNKSSYDKHSLTNIYDMILTVADLGLTINCLDGFIFGDINNNYIFNKTTMPNFALPASLLKKLYQMNSDVYFIDNYLYTNLEELDVFVTKHRTPGLCPIPFLTKKRGSFKLELDTSILSKVVPNMKVTDDAKIKMNLVKGEITIEEKLIKSSVAFKVVNVVKSKSDNISIDKLFSSLETESLVSLDSLTNPMGLPELTLPKWVLTKMFKLGKSTMYISNTCIFMSVRGGKICFTR